MSVATVQLILDDHKEYIIRDVHEKWHSRVQSYMLEKYFKPNRLYNHLNYQDDRSTNGEYLKYLKHILQDECSIIVLHEETEAIHAVALLKCMTKENRSWTCLQYCIDGSPLLDVVELQYRSIFDYAGDDRDRAFDFLHIFEYYIEESLKSDAEFVEKFFKAIFKMGQLMKMARVSCLAISAAEQRDCFEQGFERIGRTIYSLFIIGNNRRPFAPLRYIGETEADLFAIDVVPLFPYTRLRVRDEALIIQKLKAKNKPPIKP